jgi:hypothetical protein
MDDIPENADIFEIEMTRKTAVMPRISCGVSLLV